MVCGPNGCGPRGGCGPGGCPPQSGAKAGGPCGPQGCGGGQQAQQGGGGGGGGGGDTVQMPVPKAKVQEVQQVLQGGGQLNAQG